MTVNPEQAAAIRRAIERAGKGLCTNCGVELPNRTAKYPRCRKCSLRHDDKYREFDNARGARRRQKRIDSQRCTECRQPVVEGTRMCDLHHSLRRDRYRAKLDSGECVQGACKIFVESGKTMCRRHLAMSAANTARCKARRTEKADLEAYKS